MKGIGNWWRNSVEVIKSFGIKNRYPCKIIGERKSEQGKTIVIYKVLSQQALFEVSLEDLIEDPSVLQKIDPVETLQLGIIAFGDIFFNLPHAEARQKYNELLDKLPIPRHVK